MRSRSPSWAVECSPTSRESSAGQSLRELARRLEQFKPGRWSLIFTDQKGKALRRKRWNEVRAEAVDRASHLCADDEDGARQAIDGVFGRGVSPVWPDVASDS